MKSRIWVRLLLLTLMVGLFVNVPVQGGQRGPTIRHEPVRIGARGQSLAIRASVKDAVKVQTVYLYYSVSRDAAPYRLTMLGTGADGYLVTIAGALLGTSTQVTYYIEAVGEGDRSSETPWYKIDLRSSQAGNEPAGPAPEKKSSWVKPALYVGGAAVLIGGAALAASSGGGGGGGDGGGGSTTNAGSYAGTVTTCFELTGSAPTCASNPMRILVTTDGVVNSDTLRQGTYVEGRLSGSNFLIISPVSTTNRTGEIRYEGTIINDRITGSISGTARSSEGIGGVYSGVFNATRQ